MSVMEYTIQPIKNHVEVFDNHGKFIESADSYEEAIHDIEEDYE